jgi:UDP-glucuronate 4-epimerase
VQERFLITGALGCIGAWASAKLVREGVPVVAYDLGDDTARLELVLSPAELEQVPLVRGDVTNLEQLETTIAAHGITHVIHLAAMLIPVVKANPPRGAAVNVVGTTNVFEAAKRRGLSGISYASSAAVYGPEGPPGSLYGVFKVANEWTARIFWQDDGIASVGLRPYTVFGPGRDQGLTADPSLAMAAAARGEGYHMRFGGSCQLQYAPDAARVFIAATRAQNEGAPAFNLGGPAKHMRDVVAAIETVVPELSGQVTFDDVQLPFPEELDPGDLEDVVGSIERTPLADATRLTIERYRAHLSP